MIGIDTNVLVRFLTQDDPEQSSLATEFMAGLTASNPGHICREVLVELVWVLERAYRVPRTEIVTAVEGLLSAQELIVEEEMRVSIALARFAVGGAGFSDHMIALANEAAGCTETVSFDRGAVSSAGMQPLGRVGN